MRGYVARKGDRWYAVIYEGLDPVTGRERRSWHPAGTNRADAERLAASLAADLNGRNDNGRSLSFGVYMTARWLPGKKVELAHSTWDGYRRKVELHVPSLANVPIRRLRAHHLERLYDEKLHPQNGKRPLAPKTVLEIHLIVRGALNDAVRRGIVTRNVALVAHATRCGLFPRWSHRPGQPRNHERFSVRLPATDCFPPRGFSPTPGSAAASCSDCSGTTSTSTQPHSRSTGASFPSATNCTSREARPATRGGRSTSTPRPSQSSPPGRDGNKPNGRLWASNLRNGCSPTSTATRSTPTRSHRPSNGSSPAPESPRSVSTTSATPTEPCSSKPVYRSRW